MKRAKRLPPLLVAVGISACAVGPDYRVPDALPATQSGTSFASAQQVGLVEQPVAIRFWSGFADALLDQLVSDAVAANHDLRIAAANLRAARSLRRLTGYDRYPTVTAQAGYTHGLQSEAQLPGFDRDAREGDRYEAGFDAIWELDVFGRVRRGVEAARADEEAGLAGVQDAQVIVTAEVARNYLVLRGLQDQLGVARRNAENQTRSLDITRTRLDAGRGNELDTARAEAQLRTTQANIPLLEAAIARSIHRLAVLAGQAPAALHDRLFPVRPMPALPAISAIGTPEALLRRRPDIRVAERNLAAATARIGVAVGDLFPKITFIGSIGYNSGGVDEFGDTGAETYAFGPSISWAALDLGRVRARIEAAAARSDAALARYEQTVLRALEETESALVSYGRALERRQTLELAAAASGKAARLAGERFEGGLTDFLDVLDSERAVLQAEDLLAQSRTDVATSLIAVYKALGGGWVDAPTPATSVVACVAVAGCAAPSR